MLKDLAQRSFEKVCLVVIADNPDELVFLSEIEYWTKSTKWTIDITLANEAPKEWQHQVGDLYSALPYRRMPLATSNTLLFVAVNNTTRPELSDRLASKGYKPEAIRWFN